MQSHDARTTKSGCLAAGPANCMHKRARALVLSCRDTAPARGAHGSCHARPVTVTHGT
jgi:hypothetical protein